MVAPSSWLAGTTAALRPPPKLSLSEWADQHFRLSSRNAAAPGKWVTRSYQRGILDAITDPAVERVSVQKSARVGYTQCIDAAIAYFMSQDPCPILVVQPTVETAKKYSREFMAPMLRDLPILSGLVRDASVKTTGNTVLDKEYPGGVLSMVGANSGAGFRMVSRRVVIFDEVDAYPPSAGDEGDPIALGEKRAADFWNRKIIAGSTPLTEGTSRIAELFEAGDRRRFYVPCPTCGHMDVLRFRKRRGDEQDGGHRMVWPDDMPEDACFRCGGNGCVIEERDKHAMLDAGEWRAEGDFSGHASFHVWAAYSLSPNATWGKIAAEFLAAKDKPDELKTFVNTVLGETWQERGEAPDWERLYNRREPYAIGTVPDAAIIALTSGTDVQKDRLVVEVVGWAANKESWSIGIFELHGDTSLEAEVTGSPWAQLDELRARQFIAPDGRIFTIARSAIDSGYNTQIVYAYARARGPSVMACKGIPGPARPIVGAAVPVDVTVRGKRIQRGHRMWPIGVDVAKGELYGWLRMDRGEGEPPPGWCHFPEYEPEFFRQLTAEHLMKVVNRRTGRARLEWQVLPNRENHHLDTRILNRAAAAVLGIDRMAPAARPPPPPAVTPTAATAPAEPPPAAQPPAPRQRSGYWGGGPRAGSRPGGWLGGRRR